MERESEVKENPVYILGFHDGAKNEREKPLGYTEKFGYWLMISASFFIGILIGSGYRPE